MSYDRYRKFRKDTFVGHVPGVSIPEQDSDIYREYDQGRDRMDLLSYEYYGNPNYDWLILQANRDISPYEFSIETGTVIRVPYPLEFALRLYENAVENYRKYYGDDAAMA